MEICGIFINFEQLQEIKSISLGVLTPAPVGLLSDQQTNSEYLEHKRFTEKQLSTTILHQNTIKTFTQQAEKGSRSGRLLYELYRAYRIIEL